MDKHFPVGSELRKFLNQNTVKVSYSCMRSIRCIIKQHNARICETEQEDSGQPRHCNCRIPEQCLLNRHCLTSKIVYKATVETDSSRHTKIYIGSTETPFKHRYMNHLTSFKHEKYGNRTELSKYIWNLKREGKIFPVSWGVLRKASAYLNLSKKCDLCLTKKLMIISANKSTLLNKRSELTLEPP